MVNQPPRTDVRNVPCPACGALSGQRCTGVRDKVRESNHAERVQAWKRARRLARRAARA